MNTTGVDIITKRRDGMVVKIPYDRLAQLFKIQVIQEVGEPTPDLNGIPVFQGKKKLVTKSLEPYMGQKVLIVKEEIAVFAEEIRQVLGDESVRILVYKNNNFLEY